MFSFPLFEYIRYGDFTGAFAYLLGCFAVIFLVTPFHEMAHAFAANKLGDPTARYMGRLSMNPLRHIDWLGAVLILAVGWGWAKPVPVNARYFKNPKRDMALTAIAGPVSNLLMGLVSLVFCNVVWEIAIATGSVNLSAATLSGALPFVFYFLYMIFYFIASINVGLAVFNLIPVPPLDGSRLLTALLPNHIYYKVMEYERYIMMGLFALIFFGVLDGPLSFLRNGAMNLLEFLAGLPFRLF